MKLADDTRRGLLVDAHNAIDALGDVIGQLDAEPIDAPSLMSSILDAVSEVSDLLQTVWAESQNNE